MRCRLVAERRGESRPFASKSVSFGPKSASFWLRFSADFGGFPPKIGFVSGKNFASPPDCFSPHPPVNLEHNRNIMSSRKIERNPVKSFPRTREPSGRASASHKSLMPRGRAALDPGFRRGDEENN
jgi:hypothetical protein